MVKELYLKTHLVVELEMLETNSHFHKCFFLLYFFIKNLVLCYADCVLGSGIGIRNVCESNTFILLLIYWHESAIF